MILPGFDEKDVAALRDAFFDKLGDELTVEINVADDIPLTSRGKLRRLVQDITKEEMEKILQ